MHDYGLPAGVHTRNSLITLERRSGRPVAWDFSALLALRDARGGVVVVRAEKHLVRCTHTCVRARD